MSKVRKQSEAVLNRRRLLGDLGKFATAAGLVSLGLADELSLAGDRATTTAPAGTNAAASMPASPEEVRAAMMLPKDLAYFNCRHWVRRRGAWSRNRWRRGGSWRQDPANEGFGAVLARAEQTREKAAKLLGCHKDQIAITRNTTEGMNAVAGLACKEATAC